MPKRSLMNSSLLRVAELIKSLSIIQTDEQKRDLLQKLLAANKPTIVSFMNAHAVNLAWENASFSVSIAGSDMVLRDGIGMSALLKLLKREGGINMNGTDFIPEIITAFAGKRVAVCGTSEPYISQAAKKIKAMGCIPVLVMEGFHSPTMYAEKLQGANADLIILGMGMPKQEAVATLLAERLQTPVVIVNGGAILDFMAERFLRAPQLWQELRLEWLYRLCNEPGRLWKRYLLGGSMFIVRSVRLGLSR